MNTNLITEMEVLVECKRLVEDMLYEYRQIAERLDRCGKPTNNVDRIIYRLERALEGKSPTPWLEHKEK